MPELIPDGPTPLYIQLATLLREQIGDGTLLPGAALPSELDLMQTYNVSRTTVRQALTLLADDNVIIKVQGKGSFIRQPTITQELMSLQTITEVLTSAGLVPQVRVLAVEMQADISPYIREQLGVDPTETVVCVKRQHLVEDQPIAYAVIYLSGRFDWRFSIDDLKRQSIYAWLETESHIQVDHGRQLIRATAASEEVATRLGLPTGSPVLYVENTSSTADGTPIDFTEFYFPPDQYSLVVSLRRTHHGVSLTSVEAEMAHPRVESQ
jgi:GntR family transcriptional regulator